MKNKDHIGYDLSFAELQVLVSMCEGKTYKEIAVENHLVKTVILRHSKRIFHKLGVKNRAEAVIKYREEIQSNN
jgi:DNA-binding NarL/FixJ family response regulator